jgi:hypothetical protein
MKPMGGYWLNPAPENEATPGLGFQLLGGEPKSISGDEEVCELCGGPMHLLAIYQRSTFIPLERHHSILLTICPECAAESDGFEGQNGFRASFHSDESEALALERLQALLPQSVYFRATPTDEPSDASAFEQWKKGKVRPKLGGRQIAIQGERPARPCRHCGSPWVFVGSIDERWARDYLNFGGGMGYLFACSRECSADAASFYWDCP